MILLLIVPVWLLLLVFVAGLCAGARLGDRQLSMQAMDAQLTVRRVEDPDSQRDGRTEAKPVGGPSHIAPVSEPGARVGMAA